MSISYLTKNTIYIYIYIYIYKAKVKQPITGLDRP